MGNKTMILETIGTLLAFIGAAFSITGALFNNLAYRHVTAMKIWMVSNVLLLVWAIGYVLGLWNGALSGIALIVMYLIFSVTNLFALMRRKNFLEEELG